MWKTECKDPIVREIRKAGEEVAKKSDYNLRHLEKLGELTQSCTRQLILM